MDVPVVEPGFEIVHFVWGYYDGILNGIAEWQGVPHQFEYFELESSGPQGEHWDRYRLTPLAPEVFRSAVDAWEIWCRWQQANKIGQAGPRSGPNPALPEDKARRCEADQVVAD